MDKRLRKHKYGFLEAISRPSDEELEDYYASKYYQFEKSNYRKSYSAKELAMIGLRIDLKAHRAAQLRGNAHIGKLLDVGCGEGFVLSAFAERGWQVTGIDHSVEGVVKMNPAQAEKVRQGNLFELIVSEIESKTLYDIVWLGNVLEHVKHPTTLMCDLLKLVAEDGLLIVTVPNDGSNYQSYLLEVGAVDEEFWIVPPEHLSYFTRESLMRIAKETGWEVSDIQGDFPIDLFLSHPGSNYVQDKDKGPHAHSARIDLENLIGEAGPDAANAFYSALAGVGLGRNMTAFLKPEVGS